MYLFYLFLCLKLPAPTSSALFWIPLYLKYTEHIYRFDFKTGELLKTNKLHAMAKGQYVDFHTVTKFRKDYSKNSPEVDKLLKQP